jgi:hypothetical protein
MSTLPTPSETLDAMVARTLAAADRSDWTRLDELAPLTLRACSEAQRDDLLCCVLGAWSQSAYRRGAFADAASRAAQGLEAGQTSQWPSARAEGLVAWARVLWSGGELQDAHDALEQAL